MLSQLFLSLISLPFNKAPSPDEMFDEYQRAYCVWPHRSDFNLHLNNAKYLSIMEHSRWCVFRKRGWFKSLFKARFAFVVAAYEIAYIRELPTFSRFTVTTKMLGWDEKYLYVEHKFIKKGVVCCHGLLKVAAVNSGRLVSSRDVCEVLGVSFDGSPDMAFIAPWKELSEEKRRLLDVARNL
ncbi:MAG: acyl-CoA thioesterase [Pseudomonadota bacterium]